MAGSPGTLSRTSDLEELAFFQAPIEGFRSTYGVVRRLPRTSPNVTILCKHYKIPKETPVGMSALSLYPDPELHQEPFRLLSERCVGDIDPKRNTNRVPFSSGSRNRPEINLAMAEMRWAMSWAAAVLYRPNGPHMALCEKNEPDIVGAVSFLMPLHKLDSRETRITVG
ncbi:uncharacterized protein K489DRAFT_368347 [Dissoconium aciculare CBS 342.82]|uniref:Uncharacterized protein n=1 Tax=Dissoconium aciculare CBS 342.82 TaxID=1314786 RepID=A0A6J3MAW5_9PEZI|nr:uncharacterized protein K489DRAFT_368347 [Dissoconium aciculare CBS 342.82]KAF1825155.1 hypothetical protein K489DRAFT_368347 [Dissoconium aciculare CBS 342.82]